MFETKTEIIDYAGTFIMLSLYQIGLFSIQKRLQNLKIKEGKKEN